MPDKRHLSWPCWTVTLLSSFNNTRAQGLLSLNQTFHIPVKKNESGRLRCHVTVSRDVLPFHMLSFFVQGKTGTRKYRRSRSWIRNRSHSFGEFVAVEKLPVRDEFLHIRLASIPAPRPRLRDIHLSFLRDFSYLYKVTTDCMTTKKRSDDKFTCFSVKYEHGNGQAIMSLFLCLFTAASLFATFPTAESWLGKSSALRTRMK